MAKQTKATSRQAAKVIASALPAISLMGGIASPQARYNAIRPTPLVLPVKGKGKKK